MLTIALHYPFILAGNNEKLEFEVTPQGTVMSKIDYVTMSDQQLRRYFLEHRHDEAAFKAYLDRRRARSPKVITTAIDPDFDAKIIAAIRQQMSDNLDRPQQEN